MNFVETVIGEASISIGDGNYSSKYPKRTDFLDSGVPFISANNLKGGVIVNEGMRFISNQQHSQLKKGHLESDDVLVVTRGNGIGGVARVEEKWQDANINAQLVLLRGDDKNISKKYLFHYVRSKKFFELVRLFSSGAAQPQLPISALKKIPIFYPEDINDQIRIAQVLSAYDNLIENNKRRIELLEKSARQLYKEWFVRFRFPGHEHVKIIDGVPEGWDSGVISDFYKTSSGGTPSRKVPEYYTGDINWVKTQELDNGFIFETSEKITGDAIKKSSAKLFPEYSVLVAMYGATIGQLGILAKESASNQACCALISNSERSHYIHAYLFLSENKSGLIGRSKGAAQNNISQDIVKNYHMVMPPKPLMEQFIDYVDPIFSQIKILSLEISKLTSARDILLPKLMNGEIAV